MKIIGARIEKPWVTVVLSRRTEQSSQINYTILIHILSPLYYRRFCTTRYLSFRRIFKSILDDIEQQFLTSDENSFNPRQKRAYPRLRENWNSWKMNSRSTCNEEVRWNFCDGHNWREDGTVGVLRHLAREEIRLESRESSELCERRVGAWRCTSDANHAD